MRLWESVAAALSQQRQYFHEDRQDIADENLSTLQTAGAVGAAVTILFFAITPRIIQGWAVTTEYYFTIPVLLGAFFFAFFYRRRVSPPNPRVVEAACATFYSLLLSVFIAMSVFPYPNTPQIYISLCYMFMPCLLALRPSPLLSIMSASEIVFLVLAFEHKTTFSQENDLFNTIAAFVFSLVIMGTTNNLRRKNFQTRQTLKKLSQTDTLTGLLNKKAFEEECANYLQTSQAQEGCALFILDMDDFKKINDNYGHPVGDALLGAVGGVLRTAFGASDYVGRIGGDEFAVMMKGPADRTVLAAKCAHLRERLDEITIEKAPRHVRLSIGAAHAHGQNINYAELFRIADDALYQAKRTLKGKEVIVLLPL